jgi:hypothetical protein
VNRRPIFAKTLEAIGLAAVIIALVVGIYGDEWGELYFFLGGILLFLIGRHMEKRWERRRSLAGEARTEGS